MVLWKVTDWLELVLCCWLLDVDEDPPPQEARLAMQRSKEKVESFIVVTV